MRTSRAELRAEAYKYRDMLTPLLKQLQEKERLIGLLLKENQRLSSMAVGVESEFEKTISEEPEAIKKLHGEGARKCPRCGVWSREESFTETGSYMCFRCWRKENPGVVINGFAFQRNLE